MNEITTTQQGGGIAALKRMIDSASVQTQFQRALGENKDAFAASIIDLYSNDKQLQGCDPKAILCEALKAATLKLPLNKALGFAYVVVYNNSVKQPDGTWKKVPTPTFVPGYKGYIQMAQKTGQYETLNADVVYEGELRCADKLTGMIDLSGEKVSDKVVGYFCYFKLLNGFAKMLYMSVHDMACYAKRYSPSVKKETTIEDLEAKAQNNVVGKQVGWEGNFNDMAIKTVIRRLLSKYGYLSIEMQNAVAGDIQFESNRNDMIAENANRKNIVIEPSNFENVTPQVPPVSQPAEENAPAPETTSESEKEPY